MARMLRRELINQLWPTEGFESDQDREDCSIQAVMARMLRRKLINQLWPTERPESLMARTGRIAASRRSWPGC